MNPAHKPGSRPRFAYHRIADIAREVLRFAA